MNKRILALAIPNILSNLTVPLTGMVDTALMGREDDAAYLAAVALGSNILNFIFWGFAFLRMGTTGLTAQAYGARRTGEPVRVLGRALGVAGLASGAILLLQIPIEAFSFWLIEGSAATESLARSYFGIRIWGVPAALSIYALNGWLLGMQNARLPLYLTALNNLLNVFLSWWLVREEGLGADGVALGSVGAEYVTVGLGLVLVARRYGIWKKWPLWVELLEATALRRFFRVNLHIFFRTLSLTFTFAFFAARAASLGDELLAANQILLQYFMLMSYGIDGFAYAAESLVGLYVGAKAGGNLRVAIRWLLLWCLGLGSAFALFYGFGGSILLPVFTDQPAVLATAEPYLPWLAGIAVVGALAFLWDGVFIGATETLPLLWTVGVSTFVVFVPLTYILQPLLGNHGLWMAFAAFMLVRAMSLSVLLPRFLKKWEKNGEKN